MEKLKWKESTQHRQFRWNTYGKNDFRFRFLFYGILIPIATITGMYYSVGMPGVVLVFPMLFIFGSVFVIQWYFGNYSRRRIALNENRIWISGLLSPWSCALEHIVYASFQHWRSENSTGHQLILHTYSGEKKTVDLPEGDTLDAIKKLLESKLECFSEQISGTH